MLSSPVWAKRAISQRYYWPEILNLVEVVQRYSKHDLTGVGLDRLVAALALGGCRSTAGTRSQPPRHKLEQRLDASVAAGVVADYEAGMPTTQLTGKYGLGKSSVLRLLRDADVEMRRQPLSEPEVDEAVRLYAAGLSVAAVGGALNLNPSTIWRTLTACGVTMRPARNQGSQPT